MAFIKCKLSPTNKENMMATQTKVTPLSTAITELMQKNTATRQFEAAFSGVRDFDFLYGFWHVHNQRLQKRLAGCDEWEEFDATSDCQSILGGAGNQDEFLSPFRPGFIGMSLRLFNPVAQQWSIYWVDNQSVELQPPVHGSFTNGTGIFEGDDTFAGKPIRVRFTWSNTNSTTPRWEQAFSSDGGKTWETNWIMDFRRPA
jgi:hypothetical protein